MQIWYGKKPGGLDGAGFEAMVARYQEIAVDLGTGDGRFVREQALANPHRLVIGVDACRENLPGSSRKSAPNSMYVIANAENLPVELMGRAEEVTINFPWGSLLAGLLDTGPVVLENLRGLARSGASLEIRLNSSALLQAGWTLDQGAARVRQGLTRHGFSVGRSENLDAAALRACPSTWARKLAYGRDRQAIYLRAVALDLPGACAPR